MFLLDTTPPRRTGAFLGSTLLAASERHAR